MKVFRYTEAAYIEQGIESHFFTVDSIKYASPVHDHDFYEFFLITKGRVIHTVNNDKQYLSEGSLVFIRPNDTHYYDYWDGSDCQFINICYSAKAIRAVFNYLQEDFHPQRLINPKLPPVTVLIPSECSSLVSRLERINPLKTTDKFQYKIQLRSVLAEILTQYFSYERSAAVKESPLWLETLLIQMNRKVNFTKGMPRLYELAGCTPGHLNRVFRQHLGTTPTGYINDLRLKYAKTMLLSNNLDVTEISMEAGFNNLSHFYHLFKEQFHMAPLEYRTKMLQSSITALPDQTSGIGQSAGQPSGHSF